MDLFAALVALGRRWYLTLALLVVLLGGTFAAASVAKPSYKAEAQVIMLGPSQDPNKPVDLVKVNPFLSAGTAVFATVVSRVMTSDQTKQQIVKAGGTSTFTVGQGASANTSIIIIDATSKSPTVATRTASLLLSSINHQAQQLQIDRGVTKAAFITTQTVVAGDKPSELQGSRTRIVVAVGAMGGILAFALVLLVDNFLTARSTKRRRDRGDDSSGGDTAAKDGPSSGGTSGGQEIPLARVRP